MFDTIINRSVTTNYSDYSELQSVMKNEGLLNREQKQRHHNENLEFEKIKQRQSVILSQGGTIKPKPKCIHNFKLIFKLDGGLSGRDVLILRYKCDGCGMIVDDENTKHELFSVKVDNILKLQKEYLIDSGWI